jgi:hypothetical protein
MNLLAEIHAATAAATASASKIAVSIAGFMITKRPSAAMRSPDSWFPSEGAASLPVLSLCHAFAAEEQPH